MPTRWLAPPRARDSTYHRCDTFAVPRRMVRAAKWDPAMCEALSNPDIVRCILTGNVGLSTFVAARAVCRAWRAACAEDEELLRAVMAYTGSLTKRDFMGLLRLSSAEADAYPRVRCVRARGGHFYLYRTEAFDMALGSLGGLAGWRARKPPLPLVHVRPSVKGCVLHNSDAPKWWLEDRWHTRVRA